MGIRPLVTDEDERTEDDGDDLADDGEALSSDEEQNSETDVDAELVSSYLYVPSMP